MKKSLQLNLSDEDLIELMRILMDDDSDGALAFLRTHFKGKARELLEGSSEMQIQLPNAGITQGKGNLIKP